MSWVPVDDTLPGNRKLIGVSPAACWLLISSWCWCKHQGTDGVIPRGAASQIAPQLRHRMERSRAISELVRGHWWEPISNGWRCHDWLDWNDSSAVTSARKTESRERAREWRAKRTAYVQRTNSVRTGNVRETYATKTETETYKRKKKKEEGAPAPPPPDLNGQPEWLTSLPWRLDWASLLPAFPGLDHEAILRDAAAYWSDHPGKYRDARKFVRSQLARAFARRPSAPSAETLAIEAEPVDWDCPTCGGFHTGTRAIRPPCSTPR